MDADPFRTLIARCGIVLLDGGLATELERQGANISNSLWSAIKLLQEPDLIEKIHTIYYKAGADVAITATYQASFEAFSEIGLSRLEICALFEKSVALARSAACLAGPSADGGARLVAASVGSYGAYLPGGNEFKGEFGRSVEELQAWHLPRIEALNCAAPDLFACETVPCIDEAVALVSALRLGAPGRPAYISFSIKDCSHLCGGELLSDCVSAVESACGSDSGVVGIGINCSDPRHISAALEIIRPLTSRHLVVYPNLGEAWDNSTYSWEPGCAVGDDEFVALAGEWYDRGARIIGGCCRTTPDTIASLRRAFNERLRRGAQPTAAAIE